MSESAGDDVHRDRFAEEQGGVGVRSLRLTSLAGSSAKSALTSGSARLRGTGTKPHSPTPREGAATTVPQQHPTVLPERAKSNSAGRQHGFVGASVGLRFSTPAAQRPTT